MGAQLGAEGISARDDRRLQAGQHVRAVAVGVHRYLGLDRGPQLTQRQGQRIDSACCLVAEQMANHRRQHETKFRLNHWHTDHVGGAEPGLADVGDYHRLRLMRTIDRHLFRRVLGSAALQPSGTHQDHGLGGKIDVLLVFD